MRYIRFLKPPRITPSKSSPSHKDLTTLITITSDLGDSFFPYDIALKASLHSASDDSIIVWQTVQWTSGARSLPITFPLSIKKSQWPIYVRIGAECRYQETSDVLDDSEARAIVSAWSADMDDPAAGGSGEAEKLVQRKVRMPVLMKATMKGADIKFRALCCWEETGESIARHLWDAGIEMARGIEGILSHDLEKEKLLNRPRRKLRVLELGAGCGIVGISIAQTFAHAEVILTDLPEAKEIVERNIDWAEPARGSTLTFKELNWDDEELPNDLLPKTKSGKIRELDIIVATDCTYNADSSPALVATIRRLTETSPNAAVYIGMKKRHPSEEVFFDLMNAYPSFRQEYTRTSPLRGDEEDHMMNKEVTYVYRYLPSTKPDIN